MKGGKEILLLLNILKSRLGTILKFDLESNYDLSLLKKYVKENTFEFIFYDWIINSDNILNFSKEYIDELKMLKKVSLEANKRNKNIFKLLLKSKIDFILLKDSSYKFDLIQKDAFRFSSDVDIFVKKHDVYKLALFLDKYSFNVGFSNYQWTLGNGFNFHLGSRNLKLYNFAFRKNTLLFKEFLKLHKGITRNDILGEVNQTLSQPLNKSINFSGNKGFIDVHYKLIGPSFPSNLNNKNPDLINYNENSKMLSLEFTLLTLAAHLFTDMKTAQGDPLLKNFIDLHFILKRGVNFEKLLQISKSSGFLTYMWFYLYFAKKMLNEPISKVCLVNFEKNVPYIDRFLLKTLNFKKLAKNDYYVYREFITKILFKLNRKRL